MFTINNIRWYNSVIEKEVEKNMEEKKNNNGLIWLIIILIILVLGLVGYIVYDKVLKVDKTISNNDEITTTITTTTTEAIEDESYGGMYQIINDNTEFPSNNDENVIQLELNTANEELLKTYNSKQPIVTTKENYEVKYMCTEVGEYFGEKEGCLSKSVEFNGIKIDETDETLTCGFSDYYLYKNYIIVANVHGCYSGCYYDLSIYNLDTKELLLKKEKSIWSGEDYLKISNDKLYYLIINKELKFKDNGEPKYVEYGYNYLDLATGKNINIKNFEGEYEPQI